MAEVWTRAQYANGTRPRIDVPTLVLYHWSQCGHCKALMPEWEKLAAKYAASGRSVRVAQLEKAEIDAVTSTAGNSNFFTESGRELAGFPEIRLYLPANPTTPLTYQGPRTAESIQQWVAQEISNTGSRRMSSSSNNNTGGCATDVPCRSNTYMGYRRRRRPSVFQEPLAPIKRRTSHQSRHRVSTSRQRRKSKSSKYSV